MSDNHQHETAGDLPEPSPAISPPAARGRASAPRRRGTTALDRSTVRRVLTRQAEVTALSPGDLRLAAGLLRTGADVDAVVEASLTGDGAASAGALRDLGAVVDAESDMDALIACIDLGPERVRAVNALLAAVEDRPPLRLHASEAKAARQLVVAAQALSDDARSRVEGLAGLLG